MSSFDTAAEARAYLQDKVDNPTSSRQEIISEGLSFRTFPQELEEGRFTNVYDVGFRVGTIKPKIHLPDQLTSAYDFAIGEQNNRVVTNGGFFFLADQYSCQPRQLALNLAIAQGHVRSLPVVDREALLSHGHTLSAEPIRAFGSLSINGNEMSWAGSLTTHEADCTVFGNGNCVIRHMQNEATGSIRVLDERSRFTPAIEDDDTTDIGFVSRGDGSFVAMQSSKTGSLDIFAHDVVIRCHERHLARTLEMRVHTIGSLALNYSLQGAMSVGPMLTDVNLELHPINTDASLGSKPPFLEQPMARTALYETDDGMVHLRLFDGRPGSESFPGVTPAEASKLIQTEGNIVWGCFLDPGQTAKLCIRNEDGVASLGNSHYLRWPNNPNEKYIWMPQIGRPVASMVALQ